MRAQRLFSPRKKVLEQFDILATQVFEQAVSDFGDEKGDVGSKATYE